MGYTRHYGATVTIEADSLEEAIPAAIRYADDNERWKDTGHASDAYAVAACEGADEHPWDGPVSAFPIPDRFTERGAPPVVTLTALGPPGSIEVAGGTVRLRFVDDAGTVTTEVTGPATRLLTPTLDRTTEHHSRTSGTRSHHATHRPKTRPADSGSRRSANTGAVKVGSIRSVTDRDSHHPRVPSPCAEYHRALAGQRAALGFRAAPAT